MLSLILLQSFSHFININSPDSLFCLVVLIYHRLFRFPFLSRPREMSSSAIKSKSFSKEALQPRDVGAVFLLRIIFVFFCVFLPLRFLTPVPGSDFTCFLGGGCNAPETCLPMLHFLLSSMDRHFRSFIYLCTDVEVPGCFGRCQSNPEGCSQAGCGFVTVWRFFNGITQAACFPSCFPSPSLLCF